MSLSEDSGLGPDPDELVPEGTLEDDPLRGSAEPQTDPQPQEPQDATETFTQTTTD